MPTYNRDYMRRDPRGFQTNTPFQALKWLLIANAGVFMLQNVIVLWFSSPVINDLFTLSAKNISSGFVWTLFTYSFLHASFFHILMNCLAIFFIGKAIEEIYGSKKLLTIYFTAVFFGGLTWLAISGGSASGLIGASAGSFGLLAFFCLTQPERPITLLLFFVLPVTLKPKWIFWWMIGIEAFLLVFYEIPGRSLVASSAHLGGILGGFLAFQLMMKRSSILSKIKSVTIEKPSWKKHKFAKSIAKGKFSLNIQSKAELKAEVDQILDKINNEGFGALTQKEKDSLDKAKKILEN